VLTRHLSKRPARLGVELLVALSLTVTFYFLVRPTCLPYRDGNAISRSVFCYLSEHVSPETKKLVQLNWKKRLAGPMLSAWLLDVKFKGQKEFDQNGFQDVFGFYHATWLFLLFLLLILYCRDALLIMLGVFGGLMYNLTDPAQGNPDAQYNLGVLHRNGLGVKQDYETAVHWFQKSARQGHVQAQRDPGKMYERGQGVKPDCQEAYQWLKLAQLQGDEEAENELKICAAAMSADQIAAAEKMAREFRTSGK
jgi:hypothetical protein